MTETQSQSADERQFAFGASRSDGESCPAVTVGHNPTETHRGPLGRVTRVYDRILRESAESRGPGTVPESTAEEAWNEALDELEREGSPNAHSVGRNIAEKLGWLDNE